MIVDMDRMLPRGLCGKWSVVYKVFGGLAG